MGSTFKVRKFIEENWLGGLLFTLGLAFIVAYEWWEGGNWQWAAAGMVVSGTVTLRSNWYRWRCNREGVDTEALIVDFEKVVQRVPFFETKTVTFYLHLQYDVPGHPESPVTARHEVDDLHQMAMTVGKTLPIRYLPSNPSKILVPDFESFLEDQGIGEPAWLDG